MLEQVQTATKALKQAAQLGVSCYDAPQLQAMPDRDAILVLSFGTTFPETRHRTIEAVVADIQAAHPGVTVRLAFTSHIVIRRIREQEGRNYLTPEEALNQLRLEGFTRIAMTSLDVIPGIEYHYGRSVCEQYKDRFKRLTLGRPLIYWQGQEDRPDDVTEMLQALGGQFPVLKEDEAILLMAHGTPHIANACYAVIQLKLQALGWKNVFVYTVEGWPLLKDVLPQLRQRGIRHVRLMPLMLVAGDHASNDMAGADEDSHRSILEDAGFAVEACLYGLGENPAIRAIYTARADEAWRWLGGNGEDPES